MQHSRVWRARIATGAQGAPAIALYVALFVLPVSYLLAYSFYTAEGFTFVASWTLANYIEIATNTVFHAYFARTLLVATAVALIVVGVAFPFSYVVTFILRRHRHFIFFLVLVAMFGGYLVRIYAWRSLLGNGGIVNGLLMSLGATDAPVELISNSMLSVIVGLASYLIPLGILPIYTAMQNVSVETVESSQDLGAGHLRTSVRVVAPLVAGGLVAAFVFAFIGTAADWVTPQLLGGTGDQLVGNLIAHQFGGGFNWPLGAATAVSLIVIVGAAMGAVWLIVGKALR
jgi:spermidine/putrescine transport system permease protein